MLIVKPTALFLLATYAVAAAVLARDAEPAIDHSHHKHSGTSVDDVYKRAVEGTEVDQWLKKRSVEGTEVDQWLKRRGIGGTEVDQWLKKKDVKGTEVDQWL